MDSLDVFAVRQRGWRAGRLDITARSNDVRVFDRPETTFLRTSEMHTMTRQIMTWALGLGFAVLVTAARAEDPKPAPKAPAATPKAPAHGEKEAAHANHDDAAKLHKLATEAKITFEAAIETAQKEVKDGILVEVELEAKADGPVYEAEFVVAEKLHEVNINAVDGKVIKVEKETPEGDEKDALAVKSAAKVSFAAALEAATKEAKGAKPIEIKLGLEKDAPVYKVKLVTADKVVHVHVDGTTGAAKAA
jgi:uncharacterized membrane protein YkoI